MQQGPRWEAWVGWGRGFGERVELGWGPCAGAVPPHRAVQPPRPRGPLPPGCPHTPLSSLLPCP